MGQLQHACKVVRAGRCFMRRLYDLLANTHHFQKHFRIRLNAECQVDVEWWMSFCMHWCLNPMPVPGSAGRRSSALGCFRLVGLRHALEEGL